MAKGRPLWFIGGVLAAWAGVRVAFLWPTALPLPTLDAAPVAAAEPPAPVVAAAMAPPAAHRPVVSTAGAKAAGSPPRTAMPGHGRVAPAPPIAAAMATNPAVTNMYDTTRRDGRPSEIAPPIVPLPMGTSRLRADSWLILRPSGGDALAFGQLGASQGGARLTYALEDRRVALSARVSIPVRGAGGEAGLGIDIQPTPLPVHVLVEERVGIGGGGARLAAVIIAGTSTALPGRVRLDAYAQGGAVAGRGRFLDAAAVTVRPIFTDGNRRVELGGGLWGAAQRGLARVDIGPSVVLVAPGAGGTLRLQLDYRARLAGHARPGSGPALTLGGSF